ncbi:hypothetical protein J7K18_03455 [bacterium]|nr:hypothetical protein [bacterium]
MRRFTIPTKLNENNKDVLLLRFMQYVVDELDEIEQCLKGNGDNGLMRRVRRLEIEADKRRGQIRMLGIIERLITLLFGSGIVFVIWRLAG